MKNKNPELLKEINTHLSFLSDNQLEHVLDFVKSIRYMIYKGIKIWFYNNEFIIEYPDYSNQICKTLEEAKSIIDEAIKGEW